MTVAAARAPERAPWRTAVTAAGSPESSKIYRPGTTWANVADAESSKKKIVFIDVIPHAASCRRVFLRDAADCHRSDSYVVENSSCEASTRGVRQSACRTSRPPIIL